MKRIATLIIAAIACTLTAFAQDNIKRPDTYNYQSGIEAYQNEDYEKSMEFFDKELEQNPKNGYAMLWKAYIYEHDDKYGQAMTNVNNALKNTPKKDKEWISACYAMRALVQAELGDSVKALSDYELAYKTHPDTDYLYSKCNILNEQGKYAEVDAEIKRAMNLDENNATTWVYYGRNEDAKDENDSAIDKFSYAIKLDPEYSSAYSFRAATYFKMKKYKEASQDAITALSIDGDYKAYALVFNIADSAMNVVTPQIKAQQKKEPNEAKWSYFLGLIKGYAGDYESAAPAFQEAIKISDYEGQKSPVLYQGLAESLEGLGKNSEALDILDEAIAIDSTDYRSWIDRANILYNMGNNDAAIENATKAIEQNPDFALLYSSRARYYRYAKIYDKALEDIDTAVSLDSEEADYLVSRSVIYRDMGKDDEAATDLKDAIEIELKKSTDEQDLQTQAYAYARSGMATEAAETIEKAYKGKNTGSAEYDKACIYSLIGEKDKALTHFENALKKGLCQFVHFANDNDLDNIRDTQKFKDLINEYKQKFTEETRETSVDEGDYVEETTEIPFTKDAGIYKVKCTINGLPLHFYFDTGAADVTISSVEAAFMLKNDYLKSSDIKGKSYYGTASGDISEGTNIVLKKVEFGGLELTNVKASVVHNQQAPLLLGQTVLSRLGKIEIDYTNNVIKITSRKKK